MTPWDSERRSTPGRGSGGPGAGSGASPRFSFDTAGVRWAQCPGATVRAGARCRPGLGLSRGVSPAALQRRQQVAVTLTETPHSAAPGGPVPPRSADLCTGEAQGSPSHVFDGRAGTAPCPSSLTGRHPPCVHTLSHLAPLA